MASRGSPSVHACSGIRFADMIPFVEDSSKHVDYVVSVGCGRAILESMSCLEDPELAKKMILVDLDPGSHIDYDTPSEHLSLMKPDFKTVNDLVSKKPHVVGRCTLLLVWPDCHALFDHEAFVALKPDGVVAVWESPPGWSSGASGGKKMAAVLRHPDSFGYFSVGEAKYKLHTNSLMGAKYSKITWIAKIGAIVCEKDKRKSSKVKGNSQCLDEDDEPPYVCLVA